MTTVPPKIVPASSELGTAHAWPLCQPCLSISPRVSASSINNMPIMPPTTGATSPKLGNAPAWTLCLPNNVPFPPKLLGMLQFAEQMDLTDVVSWLPHGRAFKIHEPDNFMSQIASKFLKAKKLRSIHRQLLVWGFQRNDEGEEKDAWFHKSFLRDEPRLMKEMIRRKVRGKKIIRPMPITHNHLSFIGGEFERAQRSPAQPRRLSPPSQKAKSEGAAFPHAVLPRIHAEDPQAAAIIYENVSVGAPTADFKAVKEAYESMYPTLGITCADISGLWNKAEKTYYDGMQPCGQEEVYAAGNDSAAVASGLSALVVAVSRITEPTSQRIKSLPFHVNHGSKK